MSFNTDLLHAGVVREAKGATLTPIYQSSAFEQDTAADLELRKYRICLHVLKGLTREVYIG